MIAATYGTVEDIEILWALIAFVGILYSAVNLKEAVKDYLFVRERKISNGRRVLAQTHLISETLRLCILSIFLFIGIAAMTIPTPVYNSHTPHNVIAITALLRWGLIVSSVMLVIKTFLAKRVRDEIQVGGHTKLTDDESNKKESVS